ncbi:glutathione S-transferase family protein [Stakelama sp. CBK3Z-3]|uniref:Glutathione S-transferase family protein n=1 Tax=Stakelama flava TaxID=2860338 RepID=A0ABS6XKQ7_9SPHN|nr:glutathione S-transferase family protein [Stakelama flava]MBW4330787.1 glutathione S-transferase family protein [Stakelama flava]
MSDILLIHAPGACSRVTITALEEIGLEFETLPLSEFRKFDSSDQRRFNPTGKVPALRIGERLLMENAAILFHLHRKFPEAGLLPAEADEFGCNAGLQDLIWCAASLHPLTRMLRAPYRYVDNDDEDSVRRSGVVAYAPVLEAISARLELGRFWYGSAWSIVDTYLFWNYSTAQSGGLDLTDWPLLERHASDVTARPAFQRARAREIAAVAKYKIELLPGVQL